jgi:hypothetical protein
VDWIEQSINSRGLVEKFLSFVVEKNESTKSRDGEIVITYQNLKQTIRVVQEGGVDYAAMDRATLIEFYNATGGDNWKDKNNSLFQ